LAICQQHNIPLIEDAACAIGSSEFGVRCGAIADMTCFSFHPRKLLTTGEGGAITTNHGQWESWFNRKLNHGAEGMQGYGMDFVDYGYNFRLPELQAVMGRVQLQKLDAIVAERNLIREQYMQLLSPLGFTVQELAEGVVHNVQSLVFRVPSHVNRDALIAAMRQHEVETTIGTYCMSGTTYYKQRYHTVQPNSLQLQQDTLTLPCYAGVDVERVCSAIAQVVQA
jgi:perosamine synthetase